MTAPLRIGVLGLTHDHIWGNLPELTPQNGAELVAAADPDTRLIEKFNGEYSHAASYADYDELLNKQSDINAVWLFSDNATNVELAEMSAARGLHIMVEKPMADSLAGADRMLAAARQNNVRLMINWPFAWWPQLQKAMQLARAGELGDIWQVKYRAAHAGPRELGCSEQFCEWLYDEERNGGGAMMDYCCYGALLARALLGMPSRVYGTRGRLCKEDILVEDNAVIVLTYPRAIAMSEGSWTQIGNLSSYVTMIHGSKATLMIEPRVGGRLLRATNEEPDGAELSVETPPRHLQSAAAHFAHAIATGEEFTTFCQERICRDAQEILEAGLESAGLGSEVSLPMI